MNTLSSFIQLFSKFSFLVVVLLMLSTGNAWATLPEIPGPYKVGYQEVAMINTALDTTQINKPGEPNGRRIMVSIYYPLDFQVAKKGVPIQYKFDYAETINPSGSLPLATVKALAGNLTFSAYFGALVDMTSVLPVDSSTENCNVKNCTNGTIVGLPVSKAGPFPLIIISHGGSGSGTSFATLGEYLASYGFIVAAPTVTGFRNADLAAGPCVAGQQRPCIGISTNTRVFDLSFVITQMLAKNNNSSDPFYKKIIPNKIGAWGYSAGGTAVQSLVAGTTFGGVPVPKDSRVVAFITGGAGVLNSVPTTTDAANITVPSLWLVGSADERRIGNITASYNLINPVNAKAKFLLTISGMPHLGTYISTCDRGLRTLDMQNNGNIQPSDRSAYLSFFNFDGAQFGGFQTFCLPSQFYDPANFAALTAFGVTGLLLPEAQLPGRINLANVYEPSTLSNTSQPIVDIMSLAFFQVYLKNNILYGLLLLPDIANALDPHISLQGCIKNGASSICKP